MTMAEMRQKGLGRGFDSLLPTSFDTTILVEESERIQKLAIGLLDANPDQPRQHFDESALDELAQSIKQYGIVQPLVASPVGSRYRLIAGERRLRAAKLAGLKHVPVIVRTSKELEQLEISIIENVQRVDLSALEQAISLERLHQQFSTPYDAIAKRIGKAHSTVVNIVRLLQLPDEAKQALRERSITEGHARQILALKDSPQKQAELLKLIIANSWSVRQAERYVTSHKEGVGDSDTTHERVQTENPATKILSKRLGTPVHIKRMAHGGRLEITFRDDSHLSTLLKNLED
jgi:ParB family chromosome partitioning protein